MARVPLLAGVDRGQMGLGVRVSELARAIGFSRLRVTCRRDLKIFKRGILDPEFQKGTASPEKTEAGQAGMVRQAGKTTVTGMKNRDTNLIKAQVIESVDKPTLQGFVLANTTPDTTVYTDEARAFSGLPRTHQTVGHGVGDWVREQAHTNGPESFWAMLKRGYMGFIIMFHQSTCTAASTNFPVGTMSDRTIRSSRWRTW